MKHDITLSKNATMEAVGELNSSHCKPTFCITDFEAYTSITDASNRKEICAVNISQACRGQIKTAGTKEWCFIADLPQHYDKLIRQYNKLLDHVRELEADAAVGRAIREAEEARLEAERKAEEDRIRAEEEKQRAIEQAERACDKAIKTHERHQRMKERAEAEYKRIMALYAESEQARSEAVNNLMLAKCEI